MKKNMATAMAAAMAFGAVVPAFAAEVDTLAVSNKIDIAKAKGQKAEVKKYDEVYDTKFTDDTLKAGITVLDVIDESGDGKYLVSSAFTDADYKANANLANDIKQEAKNLQDTESEIKHLLSLTYMDGNVEKAIYKITKQEIQGENTVTKLTNQYLVTLTDTRTNTNLPVYEFNNIQVEEKETTTVEVKELDVLKATDLKLLSKYAYELDQAADKVTVEKVEVNKTTLALKVNKKDAKKTHVATINLHNFNQFDKVEEDFIRISGKNDFVGHWAENTIFDAMYTGVVDTSAKFRPEDSITRAEFIKIVNKTFKLTTKAGKETFSDVNEKDWFYNDVLIALNAGYVDGYNDGTFRPEAKITKQEAAKIVASVIDSKAQLDTLAAEGSVSNPVKADGIVEIVLKDANNKPYNFDSVTKFKDDKSIATWADESVKVLSHKDINVVTGFKGYFNPENNITRAEALTMMQKGVKLPGVNL